MWVFFFTFLTPKIVYSFPYLSFFYWKQNGYTVYSSVVLTRFSFWIGNNENADSRTDLAVNKFNPVFFPSTLQFFLI